MYCQVKDMTRLGDRTCHKCNSEIMENYLRYTESTACFIQVSLQLLDGCFMNRRLNPIPVAKMRGCACPRAQPISVLLIHFLHFWLFFPLNLAALSPKL
jgi:hypothetical protein